MTTENTTETPVTAEEENKLFAQRREKLTALREQGNAFPNTFRRDALAGEILAAYDDKTNEELEERAESLRRTEELIRERQK